MLPDLELDLELMLMLLAMKPVGGSVVVVVSSLVVGVVLALAPVLVAVLELAPVLVGVPEVGGLVLAMEASLRWLDSGALSLWGSLGALLPLTSHSSCSDWRERGREGGGREERSQ